MDHPANRDNTTQVCKSGALRATILRAQTRPVIDSWARLKQSPDTEQERALIGRRLDLLEAELQHVQHSVKEITEAQDFQRQLSDRSIAG